MFILGNLWEGNVYPHEHYIRDEKDYRRALAAFADVKEKSLNAIPEEHKAMLLDLIAAQDKITDITERDAFIEGVRFGAQFVMDVLHSS